MFKKLFTTLVLMLVVAAGGTAHLAGAAEINFGQCHQSYAGNPSLLAPGQTKTGPLTLVQGKLLAPNAFDGAQGCTHP